MPRVGFPQRCAQKEAYKSDMASLTVPCRSLDFFIVSNWFLCTDAANEHTRIVLYPYGITSRNLLLMPVGVTNIHNLPQLLDCLVTVDLAITLVLSRIPLLTISRR